MIIEEKQIIFTQPKDVNADLAARCGNRYVVVTDIAFNGGYLDPKLRLTEEEKAAELQRQFNTTTQAFLRALDVRLLLYIDHHDHNQWSLYADDPRFLLVPRKDAPSCPPLITPSVVAQLTDRPKVYVTHGDLDGIYSVVKLLNAGVGTYPEFDADATVADSRIGKMSFIGQRYESALKADLSDDTVRYAIVREMLSDQYDSASWRIEAQGIIEQACLKFGKVERETKRLTKLYQISGKVAWVDAGESTQKYDLTSLALNGQKIAQVSVIRNPENHQITISGPAGWDFAKMFGLSGGMPNRINVPDQDITMIIETINNWTPPVEG